MRYEFLVGRRHLVARVRSSAVSIGSVFVGVMALIIVLSVMNGFDMDLRDKILGANSHIIVLRADGEGIADYKQIITDIEGVDGVCASSPFVTGEVMARAANNVSVAIIKGIDLEQEIRVTSLASKIVNGTLDFAEQPAGAVLGSQLAQKLWVGLGDELAVISPWNQKTQKFRVSGIFESGMYDYDSSLVYVRLRAAQGLFLLGEKVTGIGVKVDDISHAPAISRHIQAKLNYPYRAMSWVELNRNLFSALRLEKTVMFVILALIILVAAFNIGSNLSTLVTEKTRDIGILKSMGSNRNGIRTIFILEGLMIGTMGTAIGILGGFLTCKLLQRYQFIKIPGDVYYIDTLPVCMQPWDFILVAMFSIAISLLAAFYPAHCASRLNPAEALRYE